MVLVIHEPASDGGRDGLSRTLGVAGAIYGLIATLTGGLAAAGVLGLLGPADASLVEPARLLALPWSLAAGPPDGDPAMLLGVTLGGMVVNLIVLLLAARLAAPRRKG